MVLESAAGGQADEVAGHGLAEGNLPALGERMAMRHDKDQPVLDIGERLQFGCGIDGVGHDADVGTAARHRAHNLGARVLLEIDVDIGMRRQESAERARQEFERRGGIGIDADAAAQALGVLVEVAAHQLELAGDGAGMMDKGSARCGESDAPPLALEQRRSQCFFHGADALTGRSQRHACPRRAVGNAGGVGDMQDQAKVDEIEAHGPP